MDPVMGLGLASSLITCVEFTAKVITATKVIFRSSSGLSIDNMNIEEVYTKLSDLTANLLKGPLSLSGVSAELKSVMESLQALSDECERDCRTILRIMDDLKVRQGPNRGWKSVRSAFRYAISTKTLSDIESRLARTQRTMSLHFGSLLSYTSAQLLENVNSLRTENQRLEGQQTLVLESMMVKLNGLRVEAENIRSAVDAQTKTNIVNRAADHNAKDEDHIFPVEHIMSHLDQLLTISQMEKKVSREQAILHSLNFVSRPVRHGAIPEAHQQTFEWIFRTNFSDWLRSGSGIFWVTGKAGSGKSTLMKFTAGHAITREMLVRRSYPRRAVIVSHYFWSTGTQMQKSLQGLFQSLLFHVFRILPSTIPYACPARWAALEKKQLVTSGEDWSHWTMAQLHQALGSVAIDQNLDADFYFFIDGLDEFDGDHQELCKILTDISASSTVRLCLSSRPWLVFEDSFGADLSKKLCVHELTMNDIRIFAEGQLSGNPRWAGAISDAAEKRLVVKDIAERAEGVFLWVVLVIRSLRQGLANNDSIELIRRRLHSLPTDLEKLFQHMLQAVDPVYHEQMAGFLRFAYHAKGPLDSILYWFYEKEFHDGDYALDLSVGTVPESELENRRELARRRITARTNGLLEVRGTSVEFLHRTVRDFIHTKEMIAFLERQELQKRDIFLSIAKSYLAAIKTTKYDATIIRFAPGQTMGTLIDHVVETCWYASQTSAGLLDEATLLVDDLEQCYLAMLNSSQAIMAPGGSAGMDPRLPFREIILNSNLPHYLETKLLEDPDYLSVFDMLPLTYVLSKSVPSAQMIKVLLKHGQDPNECWLDLVSGGLPLTLRDILESDLFTLCLERGADPNTISPTFLFSKDTMEGQTAFLDFLMIPTKSPGRSKISFRNEIINSPGLVLRYMQSLDAFLSASPTLNTSTMGC